jgi:hypothetical protein
MAIRKKSVVGTVAGLLNGGVALYVALRTFQWILTGRWPSQPANFWPFLVALAVLLVNVAYLVIFFKEAFGGSGEVRYITTRAPDGAARISVRALRGTLRRTVQEQEGIATARIRLRREAEGKIRISAKVRAEGRQNAVELAGRVREVIRNRFFQVVPDDGTLALHVVVKIASLGEVVAVDPDRATETEPRAEDEDDMFTGPRYPVEDMEGV